MKMIAVHEKIARDHQVRAAANPVLGLRGLKAPSNRGKMSIAEVLRLRASSAASCDKAVWRSAQDDGFVGVSTEASRNKSALTGESALTGVCPGLFPGRLCGTICGAPAVLSIPM